MSLFVAVEASHCLLVRPTGVDPIKLTSTSTFPSLHQTDSLSLSRLEWPVPFLSSDHSTVSVLYHLLPS